MIYSVPILCEVPFLIFPSFFLNLGPCVELQSTKTTGNNFTKYMTLSFQTAYNLTLLRCSFIKFLAVFKEY